MMPISTVLSAAAVTSSAPTLQMAICVAIVLALAIATWLKVRSSHDAHDGSGKDVFLAGGGLSWIFVAGSITLTNLSTEQLVGMNGNQMLLLAWWEIAGFLGLLILAYVFVPVYYRHRCTTVTELLDRRYQGHGNGLRLVVGSLFFVGAVLIFLPAALYSGSLFLKTMFGVDWPLIWFAAPMAAIAALYTIMGGLKAVAITDTFSGIGVLGIALIIVVLAMNAIDWDLSGIPAERLSMIGSNSSPIPFHTLFTGMIFIQIFYWSTNQNITQKAMTAPTVREAQRGVLAAAIVRILIIPLIVVVPGVVAWKLFGPLGDAAYGRIVAHVLPQWALGIFAAMMAAAVIAHTASILNGTVALYAVDFHDKMIAPVKDYWRLSALVTITLAVIAVALVPLYQSAESIINLLQQLNGLASMPILSTFIVGLLFQNVHARAALAGLVWGVLFYAVANMLLERHPIAGLHYIDMMLITLISSVLMALAVNRWVLGLKARYVGLSAGLPADAQPE